MNSLSRPRTEPEALAQAEALLERYFAAEVPVHWPAVPAVPPAPRRRFFLRRQHVALAASFVAAILCWWAFGLAQVTAPEARPGTGSPPIVKHPTHLRPVNTASHRPPGR